MAIKLPLQIRYLSHSLPLSHFPSMMKSGPTVYSSRSLPVLCRAFPFRFRLHCLSTRSNQQAGCRGFSTRPIRSRGEVRASKSLIEDEAELSDWVGELKSDSNRGRRFSSDDDGPDVDRPRSKGRDRDGDRNRGREPFSMKRGTVNESGESTRRGSRDSGKSSWNQRFGVDDSGSKDLRDDYSTGHRGKSPRSSFGDRKERNLDSGFGRDRDSRRTDRNSNFGSRRKNGFVKKERHSDSGFGRDRDSRTDRSSNFGSRGENDFVKRERNSDSGFSREKGFVKKDRDAASGFRRENALARKGRNSDSGFGRDKGLREGKKNHKVVARFKEDEDESDDESDDDSDEESDDEGVDMVTGGIQDLVSEEDSEEYDDDDVILRKKASSALGFSEEIGEKDNTKSSPEQSKSYLSDTRFDQFALSPLSLKAIKDAGYENMTVVQEASLPLILKGKDVLAKAKTGTGKTVAFLLPSIEVVVKTPPVDRDNKRPPIYVLVICPTRELAIQAAAEADRLLKHHSSIGVQAVMGGTRLASEQKRIQANPCQILVATPGRLKDHIENTAGFATRLKGVKVLVLDEADHLLDMGFRKDIERIVAAVPKQRQTLLFSATVPDEVKQICHIALRRDHEFVNTVHEGSEETHAQVKQTLMVASLDKQFSLLFVLLKEHMADNVDYKVIVFCTTAMVTKLLANLLGELKLNVREIHSRKPQSYRTRVSDEFRKSKGIILVTSDVSARGVDYPDVSLVIQLGVPSDREQYIHRLGRTGRKGKEGQGILLLAPWEEFFSSSIKDLPITKDPLPSIDPEAKRKVEKALCNVEMKNKESAYQAWLGYYNSQKAIGKDKTRLVELANDFSRSMGLDDPPAIPKMVLGKMGLRNVPGLRSK